VVPAARPHPPLAAPVRLNNISSRAGDATKQQEEKKEESPMAAHIGDSVLSEGYFEMTKLCFGLVLPPQTALKLYVPFFSPNFLALNLYS